MPPPKSTISRLLAAGTPSSSPSFRTRASSAQSMAAAARLAGPSPPLPEVNVLKRTDFSAAREVGGPLPAPAPAWAACAEAISATITLDRPGESPAEVTAATPRSRASAARARTPAE